MMSNKRRVGLLIGIFAFTTFLASAIIVTLLYRTAFNEEKVRLAEAARSQVRLIEAIAKFNETYTADYSAGSEITTLQQIKEAHEIFQGFGKTGEIAVGRKDDDQIVLLLQQRHHGIEIPKTIPLNSKLAEPMRLALSGRSGIVTGTDYRGAYVLTAYEPVEGQKLGVVAKIDMSEIYAPFIKAGLFSGSAVVFLILAGGFLLIRLNQPLIRKMEQQTRELSKTNASLQREIDEHLQVQRSLLQSENKFRKIMVSARDAILMMDDSGCVTYWNPAAEKMFGFSGSEIIGKQLHDHLAPEQYRIDAQSGLKKFTETGTGAAMDQVLELSALRKNGSEFPIELSLSPLVLDGKFNAVGIIRDISKRLETEERNHKLRKQLEQSQKMEAIGSLAAGIAHDFNNILACIIGYTELLLDTEKKGNKKYQNLQEVLTAACRARDLVKQILAFSRQHEFELKPINVKSMTEEVTQLLRASLPSTIEIRLDVRCEATVMGDPTQIHQVLMNLCTNAGHAMKGAGGILKLTVSEKELNNPTKNGSRDLAPGRYAVLAVRDSGHGMRREVLDRVFDPFYTTKAPGEGSGMGLSVAYGIIKNHHGTIMAESEPEQGSVFTVFLPVLDSRLEKQKPLDIEAPTGSGRILFIDDEPSIVKMGTQMLESLGYETEGRMSGTEALELLKARADSFDLVITDMTMPKMTGDELATEIQLIRQDLPVILCSGFSAYMNKQQAAKIGIKAFVMKPLLKQEIARTVQRVLA